MSPEYAMFGQYSEKSDVFSFGVMVLEIIAGKKNLSSYESHRFVEGLLSYVSITFNLLHCPYMPYIQSTFELIQMQTVVKKLTQFDKLLQVWRQWKFQTSLPILDSNIVENYSENEVNKCIQIALLCVQQNPDDRPTMTSIVSYLNSLLIALPTPKEPAFFLHNGMDLEEVAHESSSNQSTNSSKPFSMNEMPISEFLPR